MRFIVDAKDPGHFGTSLNADALIEFGRAFGEMISCGTQQPKLALFSSSNYAEVK
jgi:hypothetical protein